MKTMRAFFLILLCQGVVMAANFTVHVLNPWLDDAQANRRDSLRMFGNNEVGYYPGSSMQNEGGGWFYYIYDSLKRTSKDPLSVATWVGPQVHQGYVTYGTKFRIDSLFMNVPSEVDEIWLVLSSDSTKFPTVLTVPPKSRFINILNPWTENSPKMKINKQSPVQMRIREDLCGWYRYYYAGPIDSLGSITFTDYFGKDKYNSSGLNVAGDPIDLRGYLENSDTVYIMPQPFPNGAPAISNKFPGRLGDCNTRKVSGIFRDWKQDDTSFFNNPTGGTSGHQGMVMGTLTAPDYKPRLTDNKSVNVTNSTKLESWFKTITFPNGQNNDTCVDLTMIKSYDGKWTFDSDKMGGFFPIDSFKNPNNIKYYDRIDPKDATGTYHNFHFSMEMHLQFVYKESEKLIFEFRGDDDVWIFVNNRLAIDLGGLQEWAYDKLDLNQSKSELQIVDGQTYNMDIFFAERNPIGSNLFIQTTMDLHNSGELYYKEVTDPSGGKKYDIWQQIETEQNDCGLTTMSNGEELSSVDFYIEGPSFSDPELIDIGVHYGGVDVKSTSTVVVDTSKVTDLKPGDYKVTFISKFNKERSGYLTFTVTQFPDHLDILPDTMVINPTANNGVDSLHMDIETENLTLLAVIRDKFSSYMDYGDSLTWKSSDEAIVTVSPSTDNKAKAVVTKVDKGSAWIIVSKKGIKSDSILISADARPAWPYIRSAVMTDSKGDCIPDLLTIALSDTFKTGQTLKTVNIDYRGDNYSIPFSDCQLNDKELIVPFNSKNGFDGRPEGTVSLVINISIVDKDETESADFTDGVGPALIDAEVLEKDGDDLDILYLTFSEPVDELTISGRQYLLIADGTADTSNLTVMRIEKTVNDSTFIVILPETSVSPKAGDSLRILPGNRDGIVSDLNNNLPHELNGAVEIKLHKGAPGILKAWYKDTDANGLIDSVYVQFKRAIELDELDDMTLELNQNKLAIDEDNYRLVNDSTIIAPISGTFGVESKIITGGSMYMLQTYKNVDVTRSSYVTDSAAPVITYAKLSRGGFDEDGSVIPDTLFITYSESVNSVEEVPFSLAQSGSKLYEFQTTMMSIKGAYGVYIVNSTEPSEITPAKTDYIWINENSGIGDTQGTLQRNRKNHKVLLEIIKPVINWFVKAGPNPVNLSEDDGIVIKTMPKRTVDMKLYNSNIRIFDGLGNQLLDESMKSEDRAFIFKWDGRNSKGRLVGGGTYKALVKVFEEGSVVMNEKIIIGIKR